MIKKIIIGLNIFLTIGATAGGIGGIFGAESMGLKVEALHNFFPSYVAPGLMLIVLIGFGNLIGVLLAIFTKRGVYYWSIIIGVVLMLWIVIQCLIMMDIVALHVIFFIVGLVQVRLGVMNKDKY